MADLGTAAERAAELAAEHAVVAALVAAQERDFAAMVEASVASNADDEHDVEGSSIAFERAQLTAALARSRARLAAIERAATDLGEGRYGTCELCGRPIGAARLEARPTATTCIDCASRSRG